MIDAPSLSVAPPVFQPAGSAFVWTRFGSEAGETILAILARKERERRANGGVFWWGVGNSVGRAISLLCLERPPLLVFSPIVGAARAVDVSPAGTVRWTAAEDWLGFPVEIPPGTLVTSREATGGHYALVCRSDLPLEFSADGERIHAGSLTNFESGRPVGASQTTAVVRHGQTPAGRPYVAALCVELAAPYFVRLLEPEKIGGERTLPLPGNQILPR